MTTTQRTDVHSPTNMDPETYEYVYAFDNQQGALSETEQDWRRLINAGISKSPMAERGTHQCHHCGAHIRYVAIMRHLPTGDMIAVGETCLDNRFALATKADFDRLRKAAALDRQAQRIKTAAAEFVDAIEDGELRNALDRNTDLDDLELTDYGHRVLSDMRNALWNKYGNLSERQLAFAGRLVAEGPERNRQAAAIAAERAAQIDAAAPTGKVAVQGIVLKRVWKDSEFGGAMKLTLKITEADGSVWLGWVTEPSAITCSPGDVVALTATWTPAEQGGNFAFGKRPSKAAVVEKRELRHEDAPSALDD